MSSPSTTTESSKSSSPTKIALPQSIVNDNAYRLLYGNNAPAITNFVLHRTRLSDDEVNANDAFLEYVLRKERGPSVDYENLARNLAILRSSLSRTQTGSALLQFYNNLFATRKACEKAAVQYYSFDVYSRMIRALLIDRIDAQFMQFVDLLNPPALENWKQACAFYSSPEQKQAFKIEWDRLYGQYNRLSGQLCDIKTSDEMVKRHFQLHEAVEAHSRFAARLNNTAAIKAEARFARQDHLKQDNSRVMIAQMGQTGAHPMHPQMVDFIEQIHENQHQKYLTFSDKECTGQYYDEQAQGDQDF